MAASAATHREPAAEPPAMPPANGAPAVGGAANGASSGVVAANGTGATNPAPVNGDQRKTLHLSLGGNGGASSNLNGNGSQTLGNGNGLSLEPPARPTFTAPRSAQPLASGNGQRPSQAPRTPPPFDAGRSGRDLFTLPEGRPAAQQPRDTDAPRKEGGNFIDRELRNRVDGDISAFLAAFDAALAADTHESRFGLREATDRLLRAGARTRIELERLEARVPLGPREGGAQGEPATWRYR